jgi:hypothetical protein
MPPATASPKNPSTRSSAPTSGRSPAPSAPPPTAPLNPLSVAAEQLDRILRELVAAHEELLGLAGAQRSAISRADVRSLSDVTNAQTAVAERIADLERQRQATVAVMLKHAGPIAGTGQTPGRPSIANLVRAIADPLRSRLLAVADRLREVLNKLHTEHMALRDAAESLSDHMEGLMRQVCRKLSHAGTYARSGAIDTSAPVITALDIRS